MGGLIEVLQVLYTIYINTDLTVRFAYTFWIIFGGLYFYASYYDKKNGLIPKRKMKKKNYPTILYIFGIPTFLIYHVTDILDISISIFPDLIYNWFFAPVGYLFLFFTIYYVAVGRVHLNGLWGSNIYEYDENVLVNDGIYGKMRHPIYFGQLLLVYGTTFIANNLYIAWFPILFTIFVFKRAKNEEVDLKDRFNNEWTKYKNTTSFMIL